MINPKFTKNILRSILRQSQGLKDHQIMHPLREWFTTLFLGVIALSVGVFLSISLYRQYSELKPSTDSFDSGQILIYRDLEIKQSLTEFSEREIIYNELKSKLTRNSVPVVPEPEIIEIESPEATVTEESSISPEAEVENNLPIFESF